MVASHHDLSVDILSNPGDRSSDQKRSVRILRHTEKSFNSITDFERVHLDFLVTIVVATLTPHFSNLFPIQFFEVRIVPLFNGILIRMSVSAIIAYISVSHSSLLQSGSSW